MSAYMRVPDHHHAPGVRCAGSGLQGQAGTEYIQCPACARHVRKVQPHGPDLGELMDRYQLTLQRTAEPKGLCALPPPLVVRAVGPYASGAPGPWRATTALAVAAWVEQHAPRYDQQARQPQAPPTETSQPLHASRRLEGPSHVLPLDAQANVASEMASSVHVLPSGYTQHADHYTPEATGTNSASEPHACRWCETNVPGTFSECGHVAPSLADGHGGAE